MTLKCLNLHYFGRLPLSCIQLKNTTEIVYIVQSHQPRRFQHSKAKKAQPYRGSAVKQTILPCHQRMISAFTSSYRKPPISITPDDRYDSGCEHFTGPLPCKNVGTSKNECLYLLFFIRLLRWLHRFLLQPASCGIFQE